MQKDLAITDQIFVYFLYSFSKLNGLTQLSLDL